MAGAAACRGLEIDVIAHQGRRGVSGRTPREQREKGQGEHESVSDGSQDGSMVSRPGGDGQGTRPCRRTSYAMVPRILVPARAEPLQVPEILERPTRLRYRTGTSTPRSPARDRKS